MNKMILMLSALLVTQAANGLTSNEPVRARIQGLSGTEMVDRLDLFLETQRENILAEVQRSLRSSLSIETRSVVAVGRPSYSPGQTLILIRQR